MLDYLVRQFDAKKAETVLALLEKNPDVLLLYCGCSNGDFTLRAASTIGTNKILGLISKRKRSLALEQRGYKPLLVT